MTTQIDPFRELERAALAISNGRNPSEKLARLQHHSQVVKATETALGQQIGGLTQAVQRLVGILTTVTGGRIARSRVEWQEDPIPPGQFEVKDANGEVLQVIESGVMLVLPHHRPPYMAHVKWQAGGEALRKVHLEDALPPAPPPNGKAEPSRIVVAKG